MLESVPKSFSWSFSRLKAFEDCPRRYHETQVLKAPGGGPLWPEEPSAILQFGDAVHTAMAHALRTNTPLPTKYKQFQQWIDKVARTDGELLVEDECQWAVTRDRAPCAWFAKNVWLRTVADAVKLDLEPADGLPTALVVDWKTGKSLNGDPVQLMLTSLMAFLQFPTLKCVRSDFIWLQEDCQTTQVLYRHECAKHWANILPRVARLENAAATHDFPPQPNRFCRNWCPVKSCEYYGRG
jgi:PD-(D/E)XK nuclease superfamily